MSRKPKKGYFVRGQFIAEGSPEDLELKRELKGTDGASRTELKRQSVALQALGADLLALRADRLAALALPEALNEALAEARRITNFEGKRRQLQFIGKLMRKLDEDTIAAARAALAEQHQGSAAQTRALHEAERWRDRLIDSDEAVAEWIATHPSSDIQQLRALVRQARKDAPAESRATVSQGLAQRHGRAYRELFRLLREHLGAPEDEASPDHPALPTETPHV
ncbi:MAG: ribosome biogenesis factor YjgA [Tibeticola sp.]